MRKWGSRLLRTTTFGLTSRLWKRLFCAGVPPKAPRYAVQESLTCVAGVQIPVASVAEHGMGHSSRAKLASRAQCRHLNKDAKVTSEL
jgi:hypothetical protein